MARRHDALCRLPVETVGSDKKGRDEPGLFDVIARSLAESQPTVAATILQRLVGQPCMILAIG